MNYPFVFRQLSAICVLLGGFMFASLPWAFPLLGGQWIDESRGFFGLLCSIGFCFVAALVFRFLARDGSEHFSKKEAMAVVGLSWILATLLGALPYLLSDVQRAEGVPISVCDALFEAQSGFSTTGATVFGELERPELLPRCILFWRCSTHFLGGLGIMVLFVVLLGFGTGTKSIVRSEMTGPSAPKDRVRHLSKIMFRIYLGMNLVQTLLLFLQGLTLYDAICHSFSTVSTGGFSTFNASAGQFASAGYACAATIEWTLVLFMLLGGTNFMLLYWVGAGRPEKMLRDTEWRTYVGLIVVASAIICGAGMIDDDFDNYGTSDRPFYVSTSPKNETESKRDGRLYDTDVFQVHETEGLRIPASKDALETIPRESVPLLVSIRLAVFQVVSILTTTGLCTDEYEKWTGLSCGVILVLMFLGGCAGSTSGGFKIIRVICLFKAMPQEIELAYRPNVVRPLFVGGQAIEKETIRHIMFHFTLLATVFVAGTLFVLCFEPSSTWGVHHVAGDRKLIDSASAVASSLTNVGPGFGLIGARQNFGIFSETSKFLFTGLMMLGRLELFVVLAMFHPGFWRK